MFLGGHYKVMSLVLVVDNVLKVNAGRRVEVFEEPVNTAIQLVPCYDDSMSNQCVTLTFAERNRLALSLSGKKPPSAN